MSKSSFNTFVQKYPGPYYYTRGSCGVDNTFDVYCETSQKVIYSEHYWEAEACAERGALSITMALELARRDQSSANTDTSGVECLPAVRQFFEDHPAPYQCYYEADEFDPGFEITSKQNQSAAAYLRPRGGSKASNRVIAEAIAFSLELLATAV